MKKGFKGLQIRLNHLLRSKRNIITSEIEWGIGCSYIDFEDIPIWNKDEAKVHLYWFGFNWFGFNY